MPRNSLQIAGALGHQPADRRVEILRRVAAVGSISQAAREVGVSYKAAWQALDTLSNLAGAALVERSVGGAGGGGARITAAGRQVLRAADEMALARQGVLERLASGSGLPASVAGLALRTSMRNQLPSRIASLHTRAGAVDVELELAGGGRLVARITRESVQLLQLVVGQEVLALCKATAVEVRPAAESGATNVLQGTVSRTTRARGGGEVAVSLAGGLQLVGFAGADSGLKLRGAAYAQVHPAAVVVALAG